LLPGIFFIGIAFLALSSRFVLLPVSMSMLLFALSICFLYYAGVFGGIERDRLRPRLLWGVPLLCILWVNLDAWFILGPLLLALAWAGSGLNSWYASNAAPAPGKAMTPAPGEAMAPAPGEPGGVS